MKNEFSLRVSDHDMIIKGFKNKEKYWKKKLKMFQMNTGKFKNFLQRLSRRVTSRESQRKWRNFMTPITTLIPTLASNKKYTSTNP